MSAAIASLLVMPAAGWSAGALSGLAETRAITPARAVVEVQSRPGERERKGDRRRSLAPTGNVPLPGIGDPGRHVLLPERKPVIPPLAEPSPLRVERKASERRLVSPEPSSRRPAAGETKPKPQADAKAKAAAATAPAGQAPDVKAGAAPGPGGKSDLPIPQPPATWSEGEIAAALKECLRKLARLNVEVEPAPPIRSGACGTPAPVTVKRIGRETPVAIEPPATLTCSMVASLATWIEKKIQPAARELLGSPVTKFANGTGYNCRNRYGAAVGKLSEHALANALDIMSFTTADGQQISVLTDWGPTARDAPRPGDADRPEGRVRAERRALPLPKPSQTASLDPTVPAVRTGSPVPPVPVRRTAATAQPTAASLSPASGLKSGGAVREKTPGLGASPPAAAAVVSRVAGAGAAVPRSPTPRERFLKRIHGEACGIFGTVLGPEANEAHRNHFHVDMAPRRRSSYCE